MNFVWLEPLLTTFGIPLVFMGGDYVLRVRAKIAPTDEILHNVGADCCLLSLGATGAIFTLPGLKNIPNLSSAGVYVFVLGVICLLRYLCLKVPDDGDVKKKSPAFSIFFGALSIVLLTVILIVAVEKGGTACTL